jgi:hypothetical protein
VGQAFFALDGLRGLYGGESDGVLAAARAAVGPEARIGVERTRFGAWLAAGGRRPPAPVSTLTKWLPPNPRPTPPPTGPKVDI